MVIVDEFWAMAATGLVDGGVASGSLLELLQAVSDRDSRRQLIDSGAVEGHFKWLTFYNGAFGYVVDQSSVNSCWDYIADKYYNPHIRTDIPAKPTGVSVVGGVISADASPAGYTLYIYSWNYVEFTLLGMLAGNDSPGAGVYVLAAHADDGEAYSFPTAYITVS